MLKLIQNEWMKLWSKKAAWVMLALLIVIIILPTAITKYYEIQNPEERTWQQIEEQKISDYQERMGNAEVSPEEIPYLEEEIALSQYRLANDIPNTDSETAEGIVSYGVDLVMFITLFTVIVAATIVSSEFSTGTIKMLLTRPVSRAKILTSKLLTAFLFGLLLIVVDLIVSYVVGLVVFGTGSGITLSFVDGVVVEESVWGNLSYLLLLSFGDFIMSTLFAFLIGSVFRSSSLAIGLTMFISFMGGMIVGFFSKYEFVKYIWLTHSDLTQYTYDNPMIDGITMPLSLSVLAVYAVIFLIISYVSFMKRDVTA